MRIDTEESPVETRAASAGSVRRRQFQIVAALVGVALLAFGVRSLVDDPTHAGSIDQSGVQAFGGGYPCRFLAGGEAAPTPPPDLGALVDCLRLTPTEDWPIGVFDADGRGYLVEAGDGDVHLRAVARCIQYGSAPAETVVVESLGWEFRARGGSTRFSLAGYGAAPSEHFVEETDDGQMIVGASFGSGPEPDADVELPNSWRDERHVGAVMELHACGVPLAEAVALIEPLAGGSPG